MSDISDVNDKGNYVRVAVPVPLFKEFVYRVPAGLVMPQRGGRVVVPFGKQKLAGVVMGFETSVSKVDVKIRDVIEVPDDGKVIEEELLKTAEWISQYYASPIGLTIRSILPSSLLSTDETNGRPRLRNVAYVNRDSDGPLGSLLDRERIFARSPKQRFLYELLLGKEGRAVVGDLLRESGYTVEVLNGLVKKGLVYIRKESVVGNPFSLRPHVSPPSVPTNQQSIAIKKIVDASSGSVFLLHGVTGSGKTLIYMEAIRSIVYGQKKTAIVLVPEISLTPQTVDRFRGAFGDDVAVIHSGLSNTERMDAWRSLKDGKKKIVVGARSALFAPLTKLGIIVVDEEHDSSYKQSDTPRYHARETAIMRGRYEGAVVVLGSATPGLETWQRVKRGQIEKISLPERVQGASLPHINVVDLRDVMADFLASKPVGSLWDESVRVLSPSLISAIQNRLDRKEQTLLLLNRRGYSSRLSCKSCEIPFVCPNCAVALTYHKSPESLVCHYCEYREAVNKICSSCGGPAIVEHGIGTQQVERVVLDVFPNARLARMDFDTTGGKWSHSRILDRVAAGEIDILLGTQMIAKGLDFPNVTLVGVIDADIGFHIPDFRADERAFQLLSQVAGRAGRAGKRGEVIIQTRQPQRHAIRYAINHDSSGFLDEELETRAMPIYPPHTFLADVIISGSDSGNVQRLAMDTAEWTRDLVLNKELHSVLVTGPSQCLVPRIRQRWRWHYFIRTPDSRLLSQIAKFVAERSPAAKKGMGVKLTVDRDPVTML